MIDPTVVDPLAEPAPRLWRRLAAIVYDALVLTAVLMLATALVVVPAGLLLGIEVPGSSPWFRAYLLLVSACFFSWFWVRGGQTVGMRAWHIRVVRADGTPLRPRDALLRFLAAIFSWACLGLGFLWVLVDKEALAWHDRLSGSRLIPWKRAG